MFLNRVTRQRLWLQQGLFLLLLMLVVGLLAWFSVRYSFRADWTAGGRNTLSVASQAVLARLEEPIRVTAYARDRLPLRESILRLIQRYQRHKADITLHFVNPDLLPDQVRQLGISGDGELYVEYRGRGEKIQRPGEQALTRTLQRLSRSQERKVVFLDGHGERKPQGIANHDLGVFGRELEKTGLQVHSVIVDKTMPIPADTAALVIASPQAALSADELRTVLEYGQHGGNLLWLLEPDDPFGLPALAALLGIGVLPGVIVDADAPRLGVGHPALLPVVDYGPHPITAPLRVPALFPQAVALDIQPASGWQAAALLESQSSSWTETGELGGSLQLDPATSERAGPLTVGVALTRPKSTVSGESAQQRVVVIGDGDFLSNTYLGNGANLELGLNILNWLVLDEALISIPPSAVPDAGLNLSEGELAGLAILFLVVLPVGFAISGWLILFYRRRR